MSELTDSELEETELTALIESTKKAIDIAFSSGVPEDLDSYEEYTERKNEQEKTG